MVAKKEQRGVYRNAVMREKLIPKNSYLQGAKAKNEITKRVVNPGGNETQVPVPGGIPKGPHEDSPYCGYPIQLEPHT